jgi:hypothetical protein
VKVKQSHCRPELVWRVDRGIPLPFRDLGARRGWWSAPRPGRFTPGKDPVPIVQEAGWAPGPVWTYAKNLAPTGIRSPDRPARSQSLYRLSYPAHEINWAHGYYYYYFYRAPAQTAQVTSAGRVMTTPAVQFQVTDSVVTTQYVNKGLKRPKLGTPVNNWQTCREAKCLTPRWEINCPLCGRDACVITARYQHCNEANIPISYFMLSLCRVA